MEKEIKLAFSFTDEYSETTNLEKTFNDDNNDIGTITWLLDELRYFLQAMGFSQHMTDNIMYLEQGEKVVNEDGEVIYERE